ncbi:TIGR01906 family membrane protein [Trichococcus ilyis]|uniref:Integral membrane protein 1906 n=1 Tax=Trichococcus ilyis TaxID=640938 RepID=A0A143YJR5_9LACT|nr:TIGR01906 family membrane protein [Trichococcus ilyis]CZQ90620.1 integral membrane protein 1906 [Trichococcus ilyis]SEI71216.1 integral membrane protein TIGR01906 [Trichococcus ilyis]
MAQKLKYFLGHVAIFLLVLSASIALTINFTPLYSFDIRYLNIEQMAGFSKDILLDNYRILMQYLNLPWIAELKMPDFPASESGLFHFHEVKRLFLLDYAILGISGVATALFLRMVKNEQGYWRMLTPVLLMITAPLVALTVIFMNFDRLFVTFHSVFFNNDAWIFDARTDPIILALPQDFFMHCFVMVFVLIELLLVALYFWIRRKVKKA